MSQFRQSHDSPIGSLAGVTRLSNGLSEVPLPWLKSSLLPADDTVSGHGRLLVEEAVRLLSQRDEQSNRRVFEALNSSSPNPESQVKQVKNLLGFTPVGFSVKPAVWPQHANLVHAHHSFTDVPVVDILEKCSDVDSPTAPDKVIKRERRKSSEKKASLEGREMTEGKKARGTKDEKAIRCKRRKRSRDEALHNCVVLDKLDNTSQMSVDHVQHHSEPKVFDSGERKAHKEIVKMYKVVENSVLSCESAGRKAAVGTLDKLELPDKGERNPRGRLVLRVKRISSPVKGLANLSDQLAFNHFVSLMTSVLSTEEYQAGLDATNDVVSDTAVLVPLQVLSELSREVIKLRNLKLLHQVPALYMCQLLVTLNLHIKDSSELQLDSHKTVSSSPESRLWRKVCLERLLRSSEAALICLNVITTPNVSKQVQLEEVIQTAVEFTRYHLRNSIYPEYDPIYTTVPKGGQGDDIQKKRIVKAAKKDMDPVYTKLCDVIGVLAELADRHYLPDATLLQISTLGVGAFFVENVTHLQLNCLKVVRAVFSHHESYRGLIVEEVFTSLSRLPAAKRNLRRYRLSEDKSIQMVAALIMQLVQSVVIIPDSVPNSAVMTSHMQKDASVDASMIVVASYDSAVKVAQKFLSTLVTKCGSKGDEVDYRPLLEYFISDLLTALNMPEWPAAELMLTVLGRILVNTFASDSCDVSLKHTALEHVGTVAASLRRDAVWGNEHDKVLLMKALDKLNSDAVQGGVLPSPDELPEFDLRLLQRGLLDYLMLKSKGDALFQMAGRLYLGQWLKNNLDQVDRCRNISGFSNIDEDVNISQEQLLNTSVTEADALEEINQRNKFLEGLMIILKCDVVTTSEFRGLSEEEATAVVRYLSQRRPFSRSFRHYLKKILDVFPQTTTGLRAKAMKALSTIVAADPHVLAMRDVQTVVYGRLTDRATSVREAATELVGSFILSSPSLATNYYTMLTDRLQDSGVSVRKRVIKVMRDICVQQPTFSKIPQMCALMIKRVSDEEGIKDLISKVFHELWFSHSKTCSSNAVLNTRVESILDAVIAADDMNGVWFEDLLRTLLKTDAESKSSSVLLCCEQIVNLLVQKMISVEQAVVSNGISSPAGRRLQACSETLYVFAKCVPRFLVRHASHLLPYLSEKGTSSVDSTVVHFTALTLEMVIPLIEAPSGTFLAGLEEALLQIMMSRGPSLVASSTKCLDAVVNHVTRNYQLVEQYFCQLLDFVKKCREDGTVCTKKSDVCRSLYVLGLLCKHFDPANMPSFNENSQKVRDDVYHLLMQFTGEADGAVQVKALSGLGFLCRRYPELMAEREAQSLYSDILKHPELPKLQCQVIENLHEYFEEQVGKGEETDSSDVSGVRQGKSRSHEDDKVKSVDWGDTKSGLSNRVAELFTPLIREAAFHLSTTVRRSSINTLAVVLINGLVHPMQNFPYLIAMSTDCDSMVREKAERILTTINSKHAHVVRTEAIPGFIKALSYQKILCQSVVRGLHFDADQCRSVCSHLYSLIRSNRQNRRSFINLLIRSFQQVKKVELPYLLFVADNLSSFPYAVLDEPLFVIHVVDKVASSRGSTILEQLNQVLVCGCSSDNVNTDDLETAEELQSSLPGLSWEKFCSCIQISHQCRLLFELRSHLKETFGLTEGKCRKYSPSDPAKVNEKPLTKRSIHAFEPKVVIKAVEQQYSRQQLLDKTDLFEQYLEFKRLAMTLEPVGDDDCAGSDTEGVAATTEHPDQQTSELSAGKKRRQSNSSGSKTSGNSSKKLRTGTGCEQRKQKRRRKSTVRSSDDELR